MVYLVEGLTAGDISSTSTFPQSYGTAGRVKTQHTKLYPKPVLRGITRKIEGPQPGSEVQLVDGMGRKVFSTLVQDGQLAIPLDIPSGMYVVLVGETAKRILVE